MLHGVKRILHDVKYTLKAVSNDFERAAKFSAGRLKYIASLEINIARHEINIARLDIYIARLATYFSGTSENFTALCLPITSRSRKKFFPRHRRIYKIPELHSLPSSNILCFASVSTEVFSRFFRKLADKALNFIVLHTSIKQKQKHIIKYEQIR